MAQEAPEQRGFAAAEETGDEDDRDAPRKRIAALPVLEAAALKQRELAIFPVVGISL